jgi:hypothetical protein
VEEAEGVEAKGLDAGAGVTAGVEEVGAAIGAGAQYPPFFVCQKPHSEKIRKNLST